ncbi:hypothetical protein DAEQUDRAFT_741540 [Daedalea quercina L-15889]|uniref:Uncharacterized protein n=1 Tax=Daedalea quercina L-15889 TaxID=1314783 RepID=A0A165L8N9_9APHY|nr:hypothetical protein DAEQUDRAFT_741540 [Daedalea quercina L-15889]
MSRQLPVTPPRRGTKRPAPSRRESLEPLLSRTPNFGDSPPQRSAASSTEVDPSELDAYLTDVGKAFEGAMDIFATPRHSPSRRAQPRSPPSARTKAIAPFLLFEPPSPSPPRKPKTHMLSKMAWGRLQKRNEDCVNTFTRPPLARVASTSRIPTLPPLPRVQRGWNTTPSRKANLRAREEAEWLWRAARFGVAEEKPREEQRRDEGPHLRGGRAIQDGVQAGCPLPAQSLSFVPRLEVQHGLCVVFARPSWTLVVIFSSRSGNVFCPVNAVNACL